MRQTRIKKIVIPLLVVIIFVGAIILLLSRLNGGNARQVAAEARKDTAQDDILGNLGDPAKNNTQPDPTEVANSSGNSNASLPGDASNEAAGSTSLAADSQSPKIINRLVTWGFTPASHRTIDTIIIHSTYNAVGTDPYNLDDIINKEYKPNGVSPHYVIDRSANIYRLVPDNDIAYHAGVSQMPDGRTNVNNFSIGIELIETESNHPTDGQYASLRQLLSYLKGMYPIKYVLGHKDISPGRKTDPWNFDWSQVK